MNVIIVDRRTNFLIDVKNRLSMVDDTEIDVIAYLSDIDEIDDYIDDADLVLIADNIAADPDFSAPTENIVGYATREEYEEALYQQDLDNIGFMRKPKALVDYLASLEAGESEPEHIVRKNTQPAERYRKRAPDTSQRNTHTVHNASRSPRKQARSSPKKRYEEEYDEEYEDEEDDDDEYGDEGDEYDEEDDEPAPRHQRQRTAPKANSRVNAENKTLPAISEEDTDEIPERAKVITVYSAKGGVGKTTLASEIGAYLALTCKKRGRLRCCIIDFNTVFGDVATTLGFDSQGVHMGMWADDIRKRQENNESTEYTAKEMLDNFIQRKTFDDKTEIYGLIADPSHEKSQKIDDKILFIIIDNVVRNGGFDYVICDTGNDTRPSSILALDFADFVFLVLTQDISTINCNDTFLASIRKIKYDEKRIRVVINNVMSQKDTAVSVQDIQSFVKYPTAAVIRHHADVIKANNKSVPLVFRSSHEYTKELRNIISIIINDGEVVADTRKGLSLFRRSGEAERKKVTQV